ncbi:hypothetical protein LOD99_12912 [Oopsacas minuta]|uniref:Basic leucine zipper domain-containing protein n=1 Tax=Oopsacas minuta TaxID=111878 RepID=A0AAV7J9Z1_9METZ|nr:hypothetical protein LOD99_12912 [Oopsacas minuta]
MSELSNKFIVEASLEDLERRLVGESVGEVTRIKTMRRRLKQRGYKKRYDQKLREVDNRLERDVRNLRIEKSELMKERDRLLAEISLYSRFQNNSAS